MLCTFCFVHKPVFLPCSRSAHIWRVYSYNEIFNQSQISTNCLLLCVSCRSSDTRPTCQHSYRFVRQSGIKLLSRYFATALTIELLMFIWNELCPCLTLYSALTCQLEGVEEWGGGLFSVGQRPRHNALSGQQMGLLLAL